MFLFSILYETLNMCNLWYLSDTRINGIPIVNNLKLISHNNIRTKILICVKRPSQEILLFCMCCPSTVDYSPIGLDLVALIPQSSTRNY